MNISLAPMEGITGHVYRRAHHQAFGHCDRYYTPFLTNLGLSRKEEVEILPENNAGMDVIPQVLTNRADVFLNLARVFQESGYREVNLNIGCPSGTVTAKRRGSGLLKYPQELEQFLEEIFSGCPLPISVKTRIGFESEEEWPAILEILNKFPFTEMIVHPRLRTDFYREPVRPLAYGYAREHTQIPLCYNGDIYSVQDYERLNTCFPGTDTIMLGRGLIANPGLAGEIKGLPPVNRDQLAFFLEELERGYLATGMQELGVLYRLLEMWSY
ncbi:MAG: tRNA-dihydrouridine synthase family protein, partial [Lachnospiraceae bacterium]|nr:tRNA-dihydrouridine synthase family protein [Lachnospiraceae bacterium]